MVWPLSNSNGGQGIPLIIWNNLLPKSDKGNIPGGRNGCDHWGTRQYCRSGQIDQQVHSVCRWSYVHGRYRRHNIHSAYVVSCGLLQDVIQRLVRGGGVRLSVHFNWLSGVDSSKGAGASDEMSSSMSLRNSLICVAETVRSAAAGSSLGAG
uniref:Uncharacterized protein n=1 Tax=Romanomermis culicivorax TaxID=13658 RepID=A0A915K2W0_ROMCU